VASSDAAAGKDAIPEEPASMEVSAMVRRGPGADPYVDAGLGAHALMRACRISGVPLEE
jgi:hypothetical protein